MIASINAFTPKYIDLYFPYVTANDLYHISTSADNDITHFWI